jgi:hypothetical protein
MIAQMRLKKAQLRSSGGPRRDGDDSSSGRSRVPTPPAPAPAPASWRRSPAPRRKEIETTRGGAPAPEPASHDYGGSSGRPSRSTSSSAAAGGGGRVVSTPRQALKPDELPSPDGIVVEEGAHVWLKHSEEMWRPCRVLLGAGTGRHESATVVDVETGEETDTLTTVRVCPPCVLLLCPVSSWPCVCGLEVPDWFAGCTRMMSDAAAAA